MECAWYSSGIVVGYAFDFVEVEYSIVSEVKRMFPPERDFTTSR